MQRDDDGNERDKVKKEPVPPKDRKRYRTPEVEVHGDVKAITKNIGSTGSDGVQGSQLP